MNIEDLFDAKDAARYATGGVQLRNPHINAGPGSYLVEIDEIKLQTGKRNDNFGKKYFCLELRIVEANNAPGADGLIVPAALKPGVVATWMRELTGRLNIRQAREVAGFILRTPPVVLIPDGFPHSGKLLPLIDDDLLARMARDNGEKFKGVRLWVDVAVEHGKADTKHEGRVFYNPRFAADADGERVGYRTFEELHAKRDMRSVIINALGDPDAPLSVDEETPF